MTSDLTAIASTVGWWFAGTGFLDHGGQPIRWGGMQPFEMGDRIELLLDSDVGSLTVKKNGDLLGVAAKPATLLQWSRRRARPDAPGWRAVGSPAELFWAVALHHTGDTVHIERADPISGWPS